LVEKSPKLLMEKYHVTTLEEIVLKLCLLDKERRKSIRLSLYNTDHDHSIQIPPNSHSENCKGFSQLTNELINDESTTTPCDSNHGIIGLGYKIKSPVEQQSKQQKKTISNEDLRNGNTICLNNGHSITHSSESVAEKTEDWLQPLHHLKALLYKNVLVLLRNIW